VFKKGFLIVMCLVLLIGAGLAACAPSGPAMPVKEGDVIKIGSLVDMTGVLSDTQGIHWGAVDYWRYVNDEKGGINGIPVKVEWGDFSYEVPKAISIYKRLRESGIVAVNVITSSGAGVALNDFFERDQIPAFGHGSAVSIIDPPRWQYFNRPSYEDTSCAMADYIMENWKEQQPPKLAYVTWDNEFGRAPINAQPYIEKKGIQIIATEFVPTAIVDVTPQLQKVVDADADIIVSNLAFTPAIALFKNAERIDILDEAQWWLIGGSQGNEGLGYKLGGELLQYMMFPDWHCSFEEDIPGVKLMKEVQTKYRGQVEYVDGGYVNGFVDAILLETCIKRVLDKGNPVTGANIKSEIDKLKLSSDELGGICYEEDFTKWPDTRRGCMWYRVATFTKDGKKVHVMPEYEKKPDFLFGRQ